MAKDDAETVLQFCEDCRMLHANDDLTHLDFVISRERANTREREVREGYAALCARGSVANDEDHENGYDEWSLVRCDCCGDASHGPRWRHVLFERSGA